ncbi:hypothetical protein DFO54_102161 [Erwinia sp. AG740]|nr:hypothetical protein DFO54_102161 [Erwinia sp. AG740]
MGMATDLSDSRKRQHYIIIEQPFGVLTDDERHA